LTALKVLAVCTASGIDMQPLNAFFSRRVHFAIVAEWPP